MVAETEERVELLRRERRQDARFFEFLTCCSWLLPLRFVIVFPCGLNFSAGLLAITPENLPTGRCLRRIDYVRTPPKWRKCESFRGNCLRGWRPERAMDLMDRPRTSIDEQMLSGRRAVVIV